MGPLSVSEYIRGGKVHVLCTTTSSFPPLCLCLLSPFGLPLCVCVCVCICVCVRVCVCQACVCLGGGALGLPALDGVFPYFLLIVSSVCVCVCVIGDNRRRVVQ